jgi:hypothetical protein
MSTDTTTATAGGLTPEELAFFEANGFVGPFTALTPDEMAERWPRVFRAVSSPSPVYGFRTLRDHHLSCRTLYEMCSHPAIVERVASLLGPDLLLWRSTIFRKLPGDGSLIWHHEHDFPGYRGTPAIDPPCNVTAWLAFTEASRSNGCVQLIPGSQDAALKRRSVPKGTGAFGRDFVFDDLPEVEPVSMEVLPGQFFLFNERVVHGSDANRSDSDRSGIAFRLTATSTRVHQGMRLDGQGMPLRSWHAVLVRGEDRYGHNRIGPPPARDFTPLGPVQTALGALRHRWLHVRYGKRMQPVGSSRFSFSWAAPRASGARSRSG